MNVGTQKMNKLKACPFCGDEARLVEWESYRQYSFVKCQGCDATRGEYFRNDGGAVKAWNTRAPDQRLLKAIEDIEKRMKNWGGKEDDSYLFWRGLKYARDCARKYFPELKDE